MEQPDPKSKRRALHVALIYAVIAAVWIYASDQLTATLTGVAGMAASLQLFKGWLFVGITSLLLYALLRNVPTVVSGEAVAPRKVGVLLPMVLFALLACAIGVTGYLVFQYHKNGIKAEKHQELAAIANLKARQISEWLSERRADAKVLKDSPYFATAADSWFSHGAPDGAEREKLARRLVTTWQSYRYAGLALLDGEAQMRLGVGDVGQVGFDEQSMALEAMRLDQVLVGDFHRIAGRTDGAIELDLYAPLKSSGDGRSVGAVLFRIDPHRFLYPLVQTWPVPSVSAESLLVERDGDEVLFLNELRHRPNSAHSLRMPLLDDLPAARAVRGEGGVMEGRDYRGEPVLAALHGVDGTPWHLVAKVDKREVYAPINQLAVVVFALVAVFVTVAGSILWLWWWQRRNAYVAQAYQAELERQTMSKHLEFLTKYANDIILLADADGWLLECNDRAVEIYGYSREELLAMNARDLRAGSFKEQFEQQWQEVDWDRGVVYEIEQQRRDGSVFPAEVSARTITLDGRRFRQGIIRDISERKAAEEKIARFTNLYAALSQTNHAIIHSRDSEALFAEVCGIAVERAGFRFAWIGLVEQGGDQVKLVARHGEDQGYLDTLAVSVDPSTPRGRGPTGTAIREGRPYLVNDYSADANTAPWQEALHERGIRSAGVFPLFREERCIGALTLYSAQVGFFDKALVDLLEEMALDISFALDNFAREAKRLAVEVALKEQEEMFRGINVAAQDAVLMIDDNGLLVYCNPATETIFGYPAGELLGRDIHRLLVPSRFYPDFERGFAHFRETGEGAVVGAVRELSGMRKGGEEFPVELSLSALRLKDRWHAVGVIRDITARKRAEESLAASEHRFRELFSNMKSGVVVYEPLDDGRDFRIADINGAVERIERVARAAVVGRRLSEIFPGVDDFGFLALLRRVWKTGQPEHMEPALYRDARISGWRENYVYRLPTGEVVAVYDDVTERMEALQKLRLDAMVFEESAEGIMITDAEQRILAVNRTFTEITGYSEAEALGRSPAMLKSDRHDHDFYLNLWASIEQTGRWMGEIWNRRKNGEVFPERLIISAARDEGGGVSHYIGVFTDISSSKEAEQRISHLTHFDALTDLPNQFLLVDHINLALAHARRSGRHIAVLSVNLDRFSNVNERYGHVIGDQVLQAVARRLLDLLREGDTVARIGADHFVIIMPDLSDKQQSTLVASKVLEMIAAPVRVGEVEFNLTARIGIALYPTDGERAEQLMQNADIALARARSIGGESYIYYTQEQSRELEELLAMESDLRHAVTRNELRLHYQPRLDLLSGEIVSLEALVRWQRPGNGLVPPGRFIPVAEHSGAIVPIGEWVLREACRQAREWHEAGFPRLKVSVNVSAVQFHQSNLAAMVGEILRETGFPANRLELEVTESLLMQDPDETVTILQRIKETGVGFSIDDFGTGYSSLAYLKRFPIDTLKIDRAFISDITFDAADAAIVQGTIALGHSLKLRILAEGVETEAQMGYLRSIHCDEMQGFFYSRPLPPEELLALLHSSRRLQDISSAPGGKRKLLLLDDEVNITTALNRVLRRDGYQVLQAHSGREALELLAVHGDVGVVVSDQRMPEMSGTEFLGKVKVLYPDIVRIILSGYTELSTITDAINTGEIYKFITKPWDDEQLRELIRDAFLRFELAKEGKAPGGPESR